uniref:Uncharacterized protein n=1 Tax=Rhizophora mucronata TaxID=61149 RepID=A0A2P2PJH5_RHIMU
MAFHETTFFSKMESNILRPSFVSPHLEYKSMRELPMKTSLAIPLLITCP